MVIKKRGLSPIVATMLLIAIVIVIGLIIFLWFRGITEEAITKFDGTNIKLVCEEVSFDASYSSSSESLFIANTGNVPIYKMKVKVTGEGSHTTETLQGGWPDFGLSQGGTFSGGIAESAGANKLLLIPVLIGHSDKGDMAYTCEERHGYEIII